MPDLLKRNAATIGRVAIIRMIPVVMDLRFLI